LENAPDQELSVLSKPIDADQQVSWPQNGKPGPYLIGCASHAAAFKANVKALFMSCGDKENPTALQTSQADLEKLGVKSTIFVQPNAQHEWRVWRASLIQFLPSLFQER
jgi:S-formylglutathione hydrolase FrmB